MDALGTASSSTTSINYTDVTKKFQELASIFYTTKGCMILTLDDTFSKHFIATHPTLQWNEEYNRHAEAVVLTSKINIIIFGQPYEVYLHRPIKQIHRWEYEYFFGFGGHNAGFSHDRIILTFSETFDKDIDVEYLLMTGTLHQGGDGGEERVQKPPHPHRVPQRCRVAIVAPGGLRWAPPHRRPTRPTACSAPCSCAACRARRNPRSIWNAPTKAFSCSGWPSWACWVLPHCCCGRPAPGTG